MLEHAFPLTAHPTPLQITLIAHGIPSTLPHTGQERVVLFVNVKSPLPCNGPATCHAPMGSRAHHRSQYNLQERVLNRRPLDRFQHKETPRCVAIGCKICGWVREILRAKLTTMHGTAIPQSTCAQTSRAVTRRVGHRGVRVVPWHGHVGVPRNGAPCGNAGTRARFAASPVARTRIALNASGSDADGTVSVVVDLFSRSFGVSY